MHALDPVLLGEGLRSAAITRGDGHQPSARVVGRWDDGALRDAGRTEDSQAKGLTHAGTLTRSPEDSLPGARHALAGAYSAFEPGQQHDRDRIRDATATAPTTILASAE